MFETFNKEDNNYKLIIERLKNGLYNEVKQSQNVCLALLVVTNE